MGTFPERQHYFAAAGESRDIGSLWRGPFFIGRILFFADPSNSYLEASRFAGSISKYFNLEGSWTPPT